MTGRLVDRVALVTGGSSGIGRSVALRLAAEGARVVVADVAEAPRRGKYHETDTTSTTVDDVVAAGGEARFIRADVADDAALGTLVAGTVDHYGGLDILVNNAGIYIPGHTEDLSIADWDRMTAVNLRAIFVLTKLALPHLRLSPHGRVIHIASVHAYGGGSGPSYAPAKAAVVNLARDQAVEFGRWGITANAICPGYIETALQDYLTPAQIEACRARTPLPRLGRPADIAHAVAFLASDEAGYITGQVLSVDGGLVMG